MYEFHEKTLLKCLSIYQDYKKKYYCIHNQKSYIYIQMYLFLYIHLCVHLFPTKRCTCLTPDPYQLVNVGILQEIEHFIENLT